MDICISRPRIRTHDGMYDIEMSLGMIMLDIYKYGVMFMHRYQISELKCESVVQLCWVGGWVIK